VTISQGKIVYQDGDVRTQKGEGRYIDRPPFASYYDAISLQHEENVPKPVERDKAKAA
jgi:dihydropyrimidinase